MDFWADELKKCRVVHVQRTMVVNKSFGVEPPFFRYGNMPERSGNIFLSWYFRSNTLNLSRSSTLYVLFCCAVCRNRL